MSEAGTVLGVVVLARHGDREGFYQDPKTYTPTDTHITPLGNHQAYQLGQHLRDVYLDPSSPDYISGIDGTLVNGEQVLIRADAGGEGGVVLNSATAMVQGLFPPNTGYNTTLANGTTIVGPMNGYQTVPIESVEPINDISLEGFVSCTAFTASTQDLFKSAVFAQKAEENADFFNELLPYLNGRDANMQNMWNVFDYMNVQSIHNATFAANLPSGYLPRARHLANWLQYHVFSDPKLDGIGNIAGRTVLPSLLNGFADIADPNNPLKFIYQAISYKPFVSLFNMTQAAEMNPELAGIVNYSAAIAFELRSAGEGIEPFLRLRFKNGTEAANFTTYNFLGSTNDVPLSTFINRLAPAAVNDTAAWCSACQNTDQLGCAALASARAEGAAAAASLSHGPISPVGAGFLGAGLALFVAAVMFSVLMFLGFLTVDKRRRKPKDEQSQDDNSEKFLKSKV